MKILFNNIPNISFNNKKVNNPISFAAKNNEDKFVRKREKLDYDKETGEGLFFEDVLNRDFSDDEELSKMPPELLQRAKEEVSFEVFMSVFEDKKLIRGFKGSYPNMDIKTFVEFITPGESSRKLVTRILTDSGVNNVGQLGRAMDIYTQKNVKQVFEKSTIDFFEILGDLKNKRDMISFPEFLLYLKDLAEDKGFEDLPKVYDDFCGILRGFGLNNLDDFNKKFYYFAPDFNNYEYISDYYDTVMYIAKTHNRKLDLLEPISAKFPNNKKLNNPEKIYVTVPEVVDTLFLQNNGENLADIENYIELAVSAKDYNHKAMMTIRPYFNNFENPTDDLRFYRLMHKNNLSISNFNKMFSRLIISDVEPMPLIDNMSNIVNILAEQDGMNEQLAKDFYLRFSDVLNVAYNAENSNSDVLSDTVKMIQDCRFKDPNELLNFYNQCNQPNKKEKSITSKQLLETVDLMRFVKKEDINNNKVFKSIRFDNLRKIRDDFDSVKEPIENFLLNKSKNIFLEDTTLSLFNKYRKEFVGCSEDELTSKLFQIDKLNIKNIEEYNRKTMEMERFETFFPSEKYLTRFIVNNQISFDNTKEEQDYKINCHRVLRSLYDPYNQEESFEKIKKLSNSRFLIKSKNSLPALFSRFSTSENNKKIINTFIDKKVKSYSSFEAFVQKYEVDKNSFDKLVTFISNLPEDVNFADAVQKLDVLNEQISNSNYPLTLNADNISNLTYDDLNECNSKDNSLNLKTLNKLLGLNEKSNPVTALPKAFYPDRYSDKSKIAKEVFQIRKDADNYPKLLNLFYPYELSDEEMSYYDLKQYSYFVPNSFVDFVNSMSKTADGRNYNMSLHSKLRIIERFLMDDVKSFSDFSSPEIQQKLDDLINSIYNQEQLLVKKSGDGERILFNSVYDGKVIESVFEKNGMLITAVEKSH